MLLYHTFLFSYPVRLLHVLSYQTVLLCDLHLDSPSSEDSVSVSVVPEGPPAPTHALNHTHSHHNKEKGGALLCASQETQQGTHLWGFITYPRLSCFHVIRLFSPPRGFSLYVIKAV